MLSLIGWPSVLDAVVSAQTTSEAAVWAAPVVALFAAAVSSYFAYRAQRSAARDVALKEFELQQTYRQRVEEWAREVVAAMSEATTLCELDPARTGDHFFHQRNGLRTKLAELIDRGRWFFENDKTGFGEWKRRANQGIVQKPIHCAKKVYRLVEELDYRKADGNGRKRKEIVEQKKDFVDEIQRFLMPSQVHRELEGVERPR